MGYVLHGRVMYFLPGSIPSMFACLLFVGHDLPSGDISCYHFLVPVQAYHHQLKVLTRVLPLPAHSFVREAGCGHI